MHAAPRLRTINDAALATGTRPGTIRVWLHRGRLTHHRDRRGRTLVNLTEVEKLTGRPAPQRPRVAAA
ncbi:hypothetical protein GCM10023347_33850 [Streptomyces chumphonensis]|uniref:MerR family transcriptional regulator n=1 Tax=Streptomyces chumphonensis TaxID=1214925 RepID=A0A927EXP8_9ACTN|nr:MerR family transcriptional regulator [Streptomyces chumphonensis]MBD3931944.1 MerR family transcriptional regulator [Streptomyces chumphonensis]